MHDLTYLPDALRVRKDHCCSSPTDRSTRGLRVGCSAAPGALPAQMPHANAQNAHIARRCGRYSSHESSHGSQAELAGSVTVSDGECPGRTRAEPPNCASLLFAGCRQYRAERVDLFARPLGPESPLSVFSVCRVRAGAAARRGAGPVASMASCGCPGRRSRAVPGSSARAAARRGPRFRRRARIRSCWPPCRPDRVARAARCRPR